MKQELFAELLSAANDALEHAQGKRSLRTTVLPRAPEPMKAKDVRAIREALQASQAVLAHYLNVSTKLVQAWEAGARAPSGPALVLLRIVERQPRFIDALYANANIRGAHRTESNELTRGKARVTRVAETPRHAYKRGRGPAK